jgi:hypothetical protein
MLTAILATKYSIPTWATSNSGSGNTESSSIDSAAVFRKCRPRLNSSNSTQKKQPAENLKKVQKSLDIPAIM